jgi:RNA polymerase sigma factor (sigma-70 family)
LTDPAERFTTLFRRHHSDVLAYALRRTNESWADDVAAETFTAAWRHLDHLPQEPLPWLYRTARSCLANKERSARRQARLAGRLAGRTARVTPDHAAGVVEGARLRSALQELAMTDREALLLVSWEGLDHATAAYVLGCSVTAFKVRLHRARRRLLAVLAATDDAAAHASANVEAAIDPRSEGSR